MSAYKRIQVELRDKETLLKALDRLGLKYHLTSEEVSLRDYTGARTLLSSNLVISRESLNSIFSGVSNDIGINISDAGCELIVGDYDANRKIPEKIKQAYAIVAIEDALARQKFKVKEMDEDALRKKGAYSVELEASKVL